MRPNHRFLFVVQTVAVSLVVAACLATPGNNPSPEPTEQPGKGIEVSGSPPAPAKLDDKSRCGALVDGLRRLSQRDQLAPSFPAASDIPVALLAEFRLGTYTCLEDHVADRIEGMVVTVIQAKSDANVGYWLLLPSDDQSSTDGQLRAGWKEYLEFVAESSLDFTERSGLLVGARPGGNGDRLLTLATEGQLGGGTMWQALLSQIGT